MLVDLNDTPHPMSALLYSLLYTRCHINCECASILLLLSLSSLSQVANAPRNLPLGFKGVEKPCLNTLLGHINIIVGTPALEDLPSTHIYLNRPHVIPKCTCSGRYRKNEWLHRASPDNHSGSADVRGAKLGRLTSKKGLC